MMKKKSVSLGTYGQNKCSTQRLTLNKTIEEFDYGLKKKLNSIAS